MAPSLVDIYRSMQSKRSNQYNAERLGLSLEVYQEQKIQVLEAIQSVQHKLDQTIVNQLNGTEEEIILEPLATDEVIPVGFHENLDSDQATHTVSVAYAPRTPDEIIRLLKLDTKVWRLSQYWNKEKKGRWEISALVSRIKVEERKSFDLLAHLETMKLPTYTYKRQSEVVTKGKLPNRGAVISLQDLHFGKPGNENMGDLMFNACVDLVEMTQRMAHIEDLYFILGSDTLNADTHLNTTTKGTIVEQSEHVTNMYEKAFDASYKTLLYLADNCDRLHVVFIPGNHDRLSSFHLLHALSKVFVNHPKMIFHVTKEERKAFVYQNSLLCFEHGDIAKKSTPLTYATEFGKFWGEVEYRTLYTGHVHKRKTTEIITEDEESGFIQKTIPSLSSSDQYHYLNKWTGCQRAAVIDVHDPKKGKCFEYYHVPEAA